MCIRRARAQGPDVEQYRHTEGRAQWPPLLPASRPCRLTKDARIVLCVTCPAVRAGASTDDRRVGRGESAALSMLLAVILE